MKTVPESQRENNTLDYGGELEQKKYKAIGLSSLFVISWQKGGVENSNGRLIIVLTRDTNI